MSKAVRAAAVAVSAVALSGSSALAQNVWQGADGALNTATNWSTGAVPNFGVGVFNGAGNTVTTNTSNSFGLNAEFTGNTSYSISGGALTGSNGATLLNMLAASTAGQTINTNVYGGATASRNVNIRNQSAASTLTVNGKIGGAATVAGVSLLMNVSTTNAASSTVFGGEIKDILTDSGKTGTGNLVLIKAGGSASLGALTLNAANTYTGGTDYTAGSGGFILGNKSALGTGVLRSNGGGMTLSANTDLSGANAIANTIRFNGNLVGVAGNTTDITGITAGSNQVTVTNATNLAVGQTLNYLNPGPTFAFPIGTTITAISGTTLTLSNALPAGASTAAVASGTNRFATYNAGSGTTNFTGVNNLEFSGTVFLGSANSTGGTTTQAFNVTNTADTIFSGSLTQEGSTVGALTKQGAGRLILSGTNNYTGATNVSAGTLLVNGANNGTGSVSVAAAGTLGGTGAIAGNVSVTGVLAPGASIESLATGNVSLVDTSTLRYELQDAGSTGADLLDITGNLSLSLAGTVTLDLIKLGAAAFADGDKLTIASYTGTYNGGLLTVGGNAIADDATFAFDGIDWTLNYNDAVAGVNFASEASGTFVTMTAAVPEPASLALLALGGLTMIRRRRA